MPRFRRSRCRGFGDHDAVNFARQLAAQKISKAEIARCLSIGRTSDSSGRAALCRRVACPPTWCSCSPPPLARRPAHVGVLAADRGTPRARYRSTSKTLVAVMARPSQRFKVSRSVHASMRASSFWLLVSCRFASTRRREAGSSSSALAGAARRRPGAPRRLGRRPRGPRPGASDGQAPRA